MNRWSAKTSTFKKGVYIYIGALVLLTAIGLSILWAFLFSFLSLASFFIINAKTGAGVKVEDILLLISLIGYAFIFRVRSLKVVRFTMFVPLSLSVLYNILAAAPLFTVLSYSFELGANIVSVFKYHVVGKKEKTPSAAKEVNYG